MAKNVILKNESGEELHPKTEIAQVDGLQGALNGKQPSGNYLTSQSLKTINGQSIVGSGNLTISGGGKLVADPIPLSTLNGKKIVCIGDSITWGVELGNPSVEKPDDANGQKYPAITDEELASSFPVANRRKSYPHYLMDLVPGLSVDNLGSSGWALPTFARGMPTSRGLSSKINGCDYDGTQTNTPNIHGLRALYPSTEPFAITVMFGVNEFTRGYPLGQPSNLVEKSVIYKLKEYDLTYISWRAADATNSLPERYVDGDGNIVATYDSVSGTFSGISETTMDDVNKKIYVLTDNIYGAWEYAALRLTKDFPSSKIYFMAPYLFRGIILSISFDEPNSAGYRFSDMIEAIVKTGISYKVPVLDLFHYGGCTLANAVDYMGDSCHLNYKGAIKTTKHLLDFLLANPVVYSNEWLNPGEGKVQGINPDGDAPLPDDTIVNVTGVSLSSDAVSLAIGDTYQLSAIITPDNATDKEVSFISYNEGVARVTENGLVTALSEGTASISCVTSDGGFTDSCEVTVSEAEVRTYTPTEVQPLLKAWEIQLGSENAPASTIEGNYLSIYRAASYRNGRFIFADIPLYEGSEVDLSFVFQATDASECIGFDSIVTMSSESITEKLWKESASYPLPVPESHVWVNNTGLGPVKYLQRSTGQYKDATPGLDLSSFAPTENRIVLRVLSEGFEIYAYGGEKLMTVDTKNSNPYLVHNTTPVYFSIGINSLVETRIYSIKQVTPTE